MQLGLALRRQIELSSRLNSALVYPAVLLAVSLLTLAVTMTVLVPNLLPLFENSRAPMPMIIRLFLAVRDHAALIGSATGMTLMAAVAGALRLRRDEKALFIRDRILLSLPVVGPLVRSAEAARVARSLALLLKSGMPVLQALSLAQTTARNRIIRYGLAAVAEQVAAGGRIGRAFERHAVMPAASCHLAAIGEETNRLDELMGHIAHIHETAMQERLERLTALATPVLTLVMGGLVAGLIFSVMKAVLSVNDLVLT
jgi:general secretion pathway protein F